MKTERGLALQDLISGAFEYIDTLELKPQARVYLLDFLATIECANLSYPSRIQCSNMITGTDYLQVQTRKSK
jgi:replication factor C subunit 3/5